MVKIGELFNRGPAEDTTPPTQDFVDEVKALLEARFGLQVRANRLVDDPYVQLELHRDGDVLAVCRCINTLLDITHEHVKPVVESRERRGLKAAYLVTTGTISDRDYVRAKKQGVLVYDAPRIKKLRKKIAQKSVAPQPPKIQALQDASPPPEADEKPKKKRKKRRRNKSTNDTSTPAQQQIRAVPCDYKGIRMRSLLERRFARELDRKNIPWKYENTRVGDACYLVDFYLPEHACWVEVKGVYRADDREDLPEVARVLWRDGKEPLFVYFDDHADHVLTTGIYELTHEELWEKIEQRRRS